MYFAPITKMHSFIKDEKTRLKLFEIYTKEMNCLHFGQNWDISWHHGTLMPTED